jgi:hypothetical protein
MPRGRPVFSVIRQNIIEILYFMKEGYAYEIYKIYKQIFPKVTMRSIYYHLKKGTSIDEFKVKEIRKEKGTFSWGSEVEKTYFELGTKAEPKLDPQVKEFFDKQ